MKTAAATLDDIALLDSEETPVRVGDLWREGPVVLVWLRHYG